MLQIRLSFFIGIFFFSYMSYSGCEDVFDSNSKSNWLTAEELVELAKDSKKVNNSRMFQVQYRSVVEKADLTDTVLNAKISDYLDFSFVSLSLRIRIINALIRNSKGEPIAYIGELIQKSREYLLSIKGLGVRTVDMIEQALEQRGLQLNMQVSKDWQAPAFQYIKDISVEILDQRIMEYLDFHFATVSTRNAIRGGLRGSYFGSNGMVYIGELIQMKKKDLLRGEYRLGRTAVAAIEQALEQRGLRLGMRLSEEWTQPTVDVPMEVLNARVVNHLDFSGTSFSIRTRIINLLNAREIFYIGELIQLRERDLLWSYRISQNLMLVIEKALAQKGLYLSTKFSESWHRPLL